MDNNELPLFEPFKSKGISQPLAANQPILLNNTHQLWFVESGSVDLFLVKTEQDEPIGARHTLFRINPGEFVLPICGLAEPWQILAASIPNTRINILHWQDLIITPQVMAALGNRKEKTINAHE